MTTCEVQSICNYLTSPGGSTIITTNASGCNSLYEVQTACTAISVVELSPGNALLFYPNPASSTITIETPAKGSVSIFNLNGQRLMQQQIMAPATTIDISSFNSGVYFMRMTGEKTVQMGKIVKQ